MGTIVKKTNKKQIQSTPVKSVSVMSNIEIIALMLLSSLLFTYVISNVGFAFNVGVSFVHPILGFLFAGLICYKSYIKDSSIQEIIACAFVSLVIFLIAGSMMSGLYDLSWDGATYHNGYVVNVYNGLYNPILGSTGDTSLQDLLLYYPKSVEILIASYSKLFFDINSGKLVRIVELLALLFLCVVALNDYIQNKLLLWLFAILVALNPVLSYQITNTYVDGDMFLFELITFFIVMIIINKNHVKFIWYLLLSLSIAYTVNTKSTALPFLVFALLLRNLYILLFNKDRQVLKNLLLAQFIGLLLGIVFFGYNPYFTNLIHHHDIFYPLNEPAQAGLSSNMEPMCIKSDNWFIKWVKALFLYPSNLMHSDTFCSTWNTNPFNIPFDVYSSSDVRIGGYGPWFPYILVSSIGIGMFFIKDIILRKLFSRSLIFLIVYILVTTFVKEIGWWARYVPYTYLIPLFVLLYLIVANKKTVAYVLSLIMLINVLIMLFVNINTAQSTTDAINKFIDSNQSSQFYLISQGFPGTPFYYTELLTEKAKTVQIITTEQAQALQSSGSLKACQPLIAANLCY